uniref:RNA-directed DNA polymerase, eukaryota n=1 Tax=Tanacetum cinerariifolium TaxID=118510 RepID=A0A6L2MX50_TANCI|nr:RNA-directed DNA polymerase, eukaryota [Tanacetum cinerariifolium]
MPLTVYSLITEETKKQNTLSKSSTETEYKALASVTSEVIWILKILKDLQVEFCLPVYLHCENNSAIKIAANHVFHERTKHLEIDLRFVETRGEHDPRTGLAKVEPKTEFDQNARPRTEPKWYGLARVGLRPGVKVGGMMSWISTWNETLMKVLNTMESIRSKFNNGMEMIEKKMVWVRWSNVLASKQKGGGGVESKQFNELSSKLLCVILPQSQDRWIWSLEGSGDISVASIRKVLDDFKLPEVSSQTRWSSVVPGKINIFAWQVRLDKLPTRLNLSLKGLDIESILCPLCCSYVESSSHLLFACSLVKSLAHKIMIWWDIRLMDFGSYEEWSAWFLGLNIRCKHKEVLEGVFYVLWWYIWRVRKEVIFGRKSPVKAIMFDEIVSWSYTWCNARSKLKFSCVDWLRNPLFISL